MRILMRRRNHSGDARGRGEEKANHDLPQNDRFTKRENLPLPALPSFLRSCRSDRKFYFSITRPILLAQHPRHHCVKSCRTSAGGEGGAVVARLDQHTSLRYRDFYRGRRSRIDLSSGNGCQVGENYASRSKPRAIMKRDFRSVLMEKEVIHQL